MFKTHRQHTGVFSFGIHKSPNNGAQDLNDGLSPKSTSSPILKQIKSHARHSKDR